MKKKGAALFIVIIFMLVLLIIGTAVITLSTSNYKMKQQKSVISENIYKAESGVDQAYGIIGSIIDTALKKNNKESKIKKYIEDNILKLNSESNHDEYDELYSGNLKVTVENDPAFRGDVMTIELKSKYKDSNIEKIIQTSYVINYISKIKIKIERKEWEIEK